MGVKEMFGLLMFVVWVSMLYWATSWNPFGSNGLITRIREWMLERDRIKRLKANGVDVE